MDFTKVKEKISGLFGAFTRVFPNFWVGIKNLVSGLAGEITSSIDKNLGRFPKAKRPFILLGIGGGIFILLIITVLIVNSGKSKEKASAAGSSQAMVGGSAIPVDELFMPGEPDYLPEYLLEREPRFSWSIEEIRPYWKSPENPELWRGEIKSAVDDLMKGVP